MDNLKLFSEMDKEICKINCCSDRLLEKICSSNDIIEYKRLKANMDIMYKVEEYLRGIGKYDYFKDLFEKRKINFK